MKLVKVSLPQCTYEIRIGEGILNQVGNSLIDLGFHAKAVIITNPVVKELYGNSLKTSLEKSGFRTIILEVPDGEDYKSLEWAGKLYHGLSNFQTERLTPVLALGGGVIGDLAGFVASTYMRGIPLVQLPTTLLAQVDSSVGGKVAVNHGQLKNMIGNFYQPRLVMADILALRTMPEKELINGLVEAIKYGLIADKNLFLLIERGMGKLKSLEVEWLEEVISSSVGIKASIVKQDERDTEIRHILNYGHTLGHAIETVSNFTIAHGSAVAIGMVASGMISHRMGVLSNTDLERIKALLNKAGLRLNTGDLDLEKIIRTMKHDKKRADGKIKFILLKSMGEVFMCDEVSPLLVKQVLEDLNCEDAQDLRIGCRK